MDVMFPWYALSRAGHVHECRSSRQLDNALEERHAPPCRCRRQHACLLACELAVWSSSAAHHWSRQQLSSWSLECWLKCTAPASCNGWDPPRDVDQLHTVRLESMSLVPRWRCTSAVDPPSRTKRFFRVGLHVSCMPSSYKSRSVFSLLRRSRTCTSPCISAA